VIKWHRSEDGFCSSKCGRYKIKPLYMGRAQPVMFRITDTVTKKAHEGFTQRDCKTWADPPKDDREWPEVTEDML